MSNIIEVKNLVKNYKDVHAVNDISFTVEEGSFFAFLGINGAGKSTTINILCTVLEKTSGNVKIGGYDLDKEKNKINYSELYFCETFWPDFKEEELCKAICDYQKRERRFGKTSEQIS